MMQPNFPFSALVGQDFMKRALLLNVVDPSLGGVLIKGERGTAKSTGVRALIDLLPSIRVVVNCPFQCDPEDVGSLCPSCREKRQGQQNLPVKEQRIRLVNLPIGTTEDRLLGTIDMEKALKSGQKAFEPGLLAEAHRGILYVDEVNLLNDQIVDLFLDAAASGTNMVEREGISFSHASRFILVGTMNPEEGDLRPQLHDRFGLSVTIEGIQSLPERVEIIKRRLAFEQDPEGFRNRWATADAALAQGIVRAKAALGQVVFTENLLETAARLAVAMDTDGHRADIAMMKAARANAALQGRARVTREDLELAALLVLGHRIKKTPLQKAELDQEKIKTVLDQQGSAETVGEDWVPIYQNEPKKRQANPRSYKSPISCVTHLCSGSQLTAAHIPWKALVTGSNPGRRFVLPDAPRGGSIHGCRFPHPGDNLNDISVVGTIRAAAPYQKARGANGSLRLHWDDLRLRKRSRKTSLALMLIVDSSASMRTNDRMSVTKGIIEALLGDLYQHRDKLGIITFRHTVAEVIQPLTHNIRDAADSIERLPVGGRTPLAAGLELGIRMLSQEQRKNVESLPTLLLFSDGRPNVSCFGQDPLDETFFYAREVKRLGIQAIFVDTETNPTAMGYGYEIAARMDAAYLPLDRLV
jgi:magnesium chelatase subunit D